MIVRNAELKRVFAMNHRLVIEHVVVSVVIVVGTEARNAAHSGHCQRRNAPQRIHKRKDRVDVHRSSRIIKSYRTLKIAPCEYWKPPSFSNVDEIVVTP